MAGILVVCTGNICRSPMAEAFMRSALQRDLGEAAPTVSSAGVIGRPGAAAMPESVRAAAERGADISTHAARRLDARALAEADLVLTMAAEHRDQVAEVLPAASPRTFTLKELVRIVESLPPQDEDRPFDLRAIVARADALRSSGSVGNPHDEDVVDPLGMPLDSYRAVAWELDEWCRRLADGLAGRRRAPATTAGQGD